MHEAIGRDDDDADDDDKDDDDDDVRDVWDVWGHTICHYIVLIKFLRSIVIILYNQLGSNPSWPLGEW